MVCIDILSVVVREIYHWQEFYLVVLLLIDKNTQISFYCAILPIGLAGCLQIKSSRKLLLNIKEIG